MDSGFPDWVLENNIPGFLSFPDLKALYRLSSSLPENSIIVEIGSLLGKSSVQLARSSPTSTVYCFDLWNGGHIKLSPDGPYGEQNTIENFKFFTQNYPNIKPKQIKTYVAQLTTTESMNSSREEEPTARSIS
jgi:hypothetical protein